MYMCLWYMFLSYQLSIPWDRITVSYRYSFVTPCFIEISVDNTTLNIIVFVCVYFYSQGYKI